MYNLKLFVLISSPLETILVDIFMVEMMTRVTFIVIDSIAHWKRYVDETFGFVKKGCVKHWLVCLSSFHKKIFIYI